MSRHRSNPGRGWTTPGIFWPAVSLAFLMAVVSALPASGAADVGALQSAVVWIRANPQSKPGAGVVIKVEGAKAYVLTAYHVVRAAWEAGSHEVAVRFHRQVGVPARGLLVKEWLLPKDDLAVLIVEDVPGKSAVPMGSGVPLQLRDPVIAIGHPAGSDWAVTEGKVSALPGRDILFPGDAVDVGNSGGPLVDAKGRMVGLIVAVQGSLGEAIAVDVIRPIVERWVGALPPTAPSAVGAAATPPTASPADKGDGANRPPVTSGPRSDPAGAMPPPPPPAAAPPTWTAAARSFNGDEQYPCGVGTRCFFMVRLLNIEIDPDENRLRLNFAVEALGAVDAYLDNPGETAFLLDERGRQYPLAQAIGLSAEKPVRIPARGTSRFALLFPLPADIRSFRYEATLYYRFGPRTEQGERVQIKRKSPISLTDFR